MYEADVLCVGGGIAGLMAAIRAAESGAKVIVAEKGNALASGAGRAGNDHFQCYIPEAHGPDINPFIQKLSSFRGQLRDKKVAQVWAETSSEIVKLWDSWGIPMKYNGQWEFAGHGFPGDKLDHLKYSGKNQKPVLHQEAQKRGVQIVNWVMIVDLLKEGGTIVGAIGLGTRDDKVMVFKAKAVILGTGFVTRLYPSPINGRIANVNFPPTVTGDGRVMAFRAGAELVGLDMPYKHQGPKYFARSGQATWVGVIKDADGKPLGPFITKPNRRYGDPVLEKYPTLFEDVAVSGKGPVYMDCTDISSEDYEYMVYFMEHEGYTSFLNYMSEEKIDLRKTPVEFGRYEIRINGGINTNEKAETSSKGLYAAGDELFGGIANAAIFGWIAGENAAKFAAEKKTGSLDKSHAFVEEKKALIHAIKTREGGADWKEVNFALQQLMQDYAGSIRSESMLNAGLTHLRRLKEKAHHLLVARNQWELVRCLEVLNLLDLGELVFVTALERKETRGGNVRRDYPVTNPMLDKSRLFVRKVNDKIVTEWREIKD
jgi:succinate dehydrogenase/fumarate reductase flavoprotein subunit